MFFNKKKRMVDVRELQRRGVVHIPKEETIIPTDKEGFVDLNDTQSSSASQDNQNSNSYFNFLNKKQPKKQQDFSLEKEGYNKKEVDSKLIDLDNKIYRLEQRIELLERKAGVNQPTGGGIIGW